MQHAVLVDEEEENVNIKRQEAHKTFKKEH